VMRGLENNIGAGTTELHVFRSVDGTISPQYVLAYLKSPKFLTEGVQRMTGTAGQKRVPTDYFAQTPFPLPPLAEQRRRVAKVEQLMRVCDELEARQQVKRESRVRLNAAILAPLNKAASLTPEEFEQATTRLADNFVTLYDSIDTVSKLRATVLQLAVQGKLVPQNLDDEPAEALVRRIKKNRGEIADTKILKVEEMPPIPVVEGALPLPIGWRWTRLAEICKLITKGSSPKWQGISYVSADHGVLFITSENVGAYKMLLGNRKFVDARFNEIEPRSILKRNDLLMNIVDASIGRVACFSSDEVANINQAVCLIRVADHSLVPYLLHFLNSETCIEMMFDKQVENARANLSMGNIAQFPLPLPPLAEQKRIVAKTNQLISLCDELEAKLRQAEADSEKLMNAAVKHVLDSIRNASETAEEVFA